MTRSWVFSITLGALVLGRALIQRRIPLERTMQYAFVVAVVVVTAVVLNATLPAQARRDHSVLSSAAQMVAGAFLVGAVGHALLKKPVGGAWLTLGLALVAMAALGRVRGGSAYIALAASFGVLGLVAANRRPKAPLAPRPRTLFFLGLLGLAAGSIATLLILFLPQGHAWALKRAISRSQHRAAFSDRLWLGSLHGLTASDAVILRLRGPKQELLRGAVYTYYAAGQWQREPELQRSTRTVPDKMPRLPEFTRIEFATGESDHYFLPLTAAHIGATAGSVRVNSFGILHPIISELPGEIWFSSEPAAGEPPRPIDRAVPPRLLEPLQQVAGEWTRGAVTPFQALSALESRLRREFSYSVDFDVPSRPDPVLYFLLQGRTGHCEYFASGMALLSRALGIPARVVTGYRVSEYNPLGKYHLVRERDAHAWVEAYLPGQGWHTFDPTPAVESFGLAPRQTPFFSSVLDLSRSHANRFLSWLDDRTWSELLRTLGILLIAIVAIRFRRGRKERLARGRLSHHDLELPCFGALSLSLSKRNLLRTPSETIEALARRLPQGELSEGERARVEALLLSYSALRYGNLGSPALLSREMERCAAELTRV